MSRRQSLLLLDGERGAFINGVALPVDGGWTAYLAAGRVCGCVPGPDAVWLRETSPSERHTLLAAYLGYGLDGFDFMIYSFIMPTLLAVWHMSKAQAGYIATGALITSAVGGLGRGRPGRSLWPGARLAVDRRLVRRCSRP